MKRILWILVLLLLIGLSWSCHSLSEKMPEVKKITCKYGNPDCSQVDHIRGNTNHICLAVHNPCWPLEIKDKAPEKRQVDHIWTKKDTCKHRLIWGDRGEGTCLQCFNSVIYDKELWERPRFVYGVITQSDTCKDGGHLPISETGTCFGCGKDLIYDKGLWRPKKPEEQ